MTPDTVIAPSPQLACGGAAGKPNPIYNEVLNITAPAVGGFIGGLVDGPVGAVIGAIIGNRSFDLLNICNQPQPAPVTLVPQDYIDAFEFTNSAVYPAANAKITQWFLNAMWPEWCLCADGTTPAPATPTAPAPVSGNPALPTGPDPVKCLSGRYSAGPVTPGLNDYVVFQQAGVAAPALPIGATSIDFNGFVESFSGTDSQVTIDLNIVRNSGTIKYTTIIVGNASALPKWDYSIPCDPGIQGATFTVHAANSGTNASIFGGADAYCDTSNGSVPLQPCCPPDPYLDTRLQLMQGMLSAILTLVGQQGGHSSYVDGTRHSGLQGFGTVPLVQAAAAVRLEVTTPPSGAQVLPGSPDFYWNMGFITPSSNDTPLRGQRLVFIKQTMTIPPVTDAIDYTLLGGTVADLVELLPGPLG